MDRDRSSQRGGFETQPSPAERRYRLLFDLIEEGALVFDVDGEGRPGPISDANDAICRRLGFTRPDLVGRELSEVVAPDRWADTVSAIAKIAEAGGGAFDTTLTSSIGTSLAVTAHAESHDEGGGKLLALFHDAEPTSPSGSVDEPPSADDLALFSRTAALFVELQPDDDIFPYVAQGLLHLLGPSLILLSSFDESTKLFHVEQLVGVGRHWDRILNLFGFDPKTLTVPINEQERGMLTNQRLNALSGGLERVTFGLVSGSLSRGIEALLNLEQLYGMGFSRQDQVFGSLVFWPRRGGKLRNRPLVEAFVNLAAVALHRQRTSAELRRSREQLIQAQKMDAVGRLAGGLAHDFNNLLTVIMGSAELLLRSLSEDASAVSLLDPVLRASEDAAALTAQLLAFSRQEVSEPEVLKLDPQVARLEKLLRRLLPANVRLQVTVPEEDIFLYMDRVHLEMILLNLTVNARDAMPDGGTIDLRIEALAPEDGDSQVSAPTVRISVSDGGLGMSSKVRAKVFDPFFTTKERGRGTGLGLATVHGLVETYGGQIAVTSKVGEGTTFTVLLPGASSDAPPSEEAPAQSAAPSAPLGTETVLLIEDQQELRSFLASLLQQLGYSVLEAATGEDGVRLGEEHGAAIDVVVTDYMLPGIDGVEAVGVLRNARPGLPVVVMTGRIHEVPPGAEPAALPDRTLRKPFTPTALARAVRAALDQPASE